MTDPKPGDYDDLGEPDTSFTTDTPRANAAVHNGQGVGAAEIAAQRDPEGGLVSPDADDVDVRAPDEADSAPDGNGRA